MLGSSGVAPIIHAIVSDDMSLDKYPSFYLITSTTLYLVGAGFYVLRIPEKYWKGTFDIWVRGYELQ
jgi:predicted membrane channel-forming protein YqfA (hemolysin III family)